MTPILLGLLLIACAAAFVLYLSKVKAEKALKSAMDHVASEIRRHEADAHAARNEAAELISQASAEAEKEARRIQDHFEAESRRLAEGLHAELAKARSDLADLGAFAQLKDAENTVRTRLEAIIADATALEAESKDLLEQTQKQASAERKLASEKAREIHQQAEAVLAQAYRDASAIRSQAEQNALQIGGEAYEALKEKKLLEAAVKAIHNIIDGYGDRYVIPTHSLLDELAANFAHTSAGEALRAAREQSRRMVEEGLAAECDYAEDYRRQTAIRFATDAFNGRVDAILSRAKDDNHGTLEQEIRDAFNLVNTNGAAFKNARVLPTYCDARLAELRWAVVVQELRTKEREEQRRIQEQIREEEKARRDFERAAQEAAKEEEMLRKAMEKARKEAESASSEEKSKLEARLAELSQRLTDAEAKNQRALSMAQQTRSGHVYIISNVGSFGDSILKIGMTRRLEPEDRIKELGDASVPFGFDVHAMIRSDDAPALERLLHEAFDEHRVNKVNYRKEFFRLPIQQLRDFAAQKGLEATFMMTAEAREYRETLAYEKMTPEERARYHVKADDADRAED